MLRFAYPQYSASRGNLALACAVLILLLAGCAGQQSRPPTAGSWEEHSAQLRDLSNWSAEGKLALRSPTQSESASLKWRQEAANSFLHLSGPLGVAATNLFSDGKTLVIRQGAEVSTWDITEVAVLEQHTGWDLPLLALPYWIKGLPAPELEIQDMELGPDPALLQTLRQDDWEIHYEAYARFGELTLPTRLHLQRNKTSVRLIIRQWQLAAG